MLSNVNMKIIDCFLFNDEIELLKFKLMELYDKVDEFVIVEANKTFSGQDKPFYFNENKDIFQQYWNKITHIMVTNMPNSRGERKDYQYNCIKQGVDHLKLKADDVIIISSIYMIINDKLLDFIKNNNMECVYSLSMDTYYYNFSCKSKKNPSIPTKVLNYNMFNKFLGIVDIITSNSIPISNTGWCLCYFDSVDNLAKKYSNISVEEIRYHIKAGKDLFDKNNIMTISKNHSNLPIHWNKIEIALNLELTDIVFTDTMKKTFDIYDNLLFEFKRNYLPINHVMFLNKLKNEYNFNPKVCYDIGSCVLHWTREAENIWKDTQVILFDAFNFVEIFYKNHQYHIGVLSDQNDKEVKFYQNNLIFGGNSYYKEDTNVFNDNMYIVKKTRSLDSIVKERNFPLPDLIKIDVQGAELDVLKGAEETLSKCKFLIIELQSVQYNVGAPLADITIDYLESKGWKCLARKFCDNGPDGDYCFINHSNI
jgi:FkbM family methyltransferase